MEKQLTDATLCRRSKACELTGLSPTSLHRLMNAGEIGYVRPFGRERMIPYRELKAWIDRNLVKAHEER